MCGIIGNVCFNKNYLKNISNGLQLLNHRGPDQFEEFSNSFGNYGFVRLKIIDLTENSNQPLISRCGKIKIIYNGEIYNYKNLKSNEFNNHSFNTTGDGEVLLHLYEKYGISFVNKIKGMFAITIIDERLKKVFLIRDRFGIKPLYYNYEKSKKILFFASEIPALIKISGIKKKVNYSEAFKYFQQGLINSNEETWFKDIYQVKPGHFLEFSLNKSLEEKKYYYFEKKIDEDEDKKNISFKNYVEIIKNKFSDSFEDHFQSDVPCGLHLSGGVDSAVLAAVTNFKNKKLNSYTFDFDEKKYSEIDFAKKIAHSTNLNNFSTILNKNKIIDYYLKVLKREYEPFSSLRILSQHNLYDNFKNDAKVILDGSGGDEIGAGYSYYLIPWYLDMIQNVNSSKHLKRSLNSINKIKNFSLSNEEFILGSLAHFIRPGSSTIDGSMYLNNRLFDKEFLNLKSFLNMDNPFDSNLRNAQYKDLFYLKLPRSLKYVDRSSMYNSIETRVPFLDHELVETMIEIPTKFKFLKNQQRILMKYPFQNYVNKEILYLNKRTIADPQSLWLKTVFKDFYFDTIKSVNFNSSGLLNSAEVIRSYENFIKSDTHENSFLLFQILNFENWAQSICN